MLRLLAILSGVLVIFSITIAVIPHETWQLPPGTLMERIEALAARHTHGDRDGQPSIDEMDRIAADRLIEVTCGYVSVWAAAHLNAAGYPTRVVDTLTLDEWNDTDNGHTLIEVWTDGDWVAFDIDQDAWFGGLSLAEWVEAVPTDDYEILPIGDAVVDIDAVREWHDRIAQVPMIREGGRTHFPAGPWAEQVSSYSSSYQPMTDWAAHFYLSAAAP